MSSERRQPPIFGPELWRSVADSEWCHFDRWFAIVSVAEFDGDLCAMRAALEEQHRDSLQGRRDVEAKLSHLANLAQWLTAAGTDAASLAASEPADQATVTKARRKVLSQSLEGRAMTEPMRRTPAVLLHERARYGSWSAFPIDPRPWFDKLRGERPVGFASKGQTFDRARRYEDRLKRLDNSRRTPGERLALYRAFHTIGLEVAEHSDDSYGQIGELRLEAFRTYVSLDPTDAAMPAEAYWQDLCELLVAESYALTHQNEMLPFLGAPSEAADMIEAILLGLAQEWRAAYQGYHGDEAEELIAWLMLATSRRDRYVPTALRLGSNQWNPIVTLAQDALSSGNRELAVEVFRAANQPGRHREFLHTRCLELTGHTLDDSPKT